MHSQLDELELTILRKLANPKYWKTPKQLGSTPETPYSWILSNLAEKGLVEKKLRNEENPRSDYVYRISEKGEVALLPRSED